MSLIRSPLKVIALDFDGTLVESNTIKDKAFETIFSDWPEHKETMLAWHRPRNTVVRREKFRYFVEEVLGESGNVDKIDALTELFSDLTRQAIIDCPWVSGATDFLDYFKDRLPLCLVSATPQEELNEIIAQRRIVDYFQQSYGAPLDKSEVLKVIMNAEEASPVEMLYIGDSPEDQQAAQNQAVHFIGVDSDRGLKAKNVYTDFHEILQTVNSCYDC
jgi:phosphoglycolate phosphatase-like HAD superfamily hydrolase